MKLKQISRRSVSVVLAVLMVLSTLLVGSISTTAATATTVYFAPANHWSTNIDSSFYKVNVHYGSNDSDPWDIFDMVDTNQTVNGKKVYKAEFTDKYDGVHCLQFWRCESSSQTTATDIINPIDKKWTSPSTYNGKFWDGSNWVPYNPDPEPTELSCPTEVLNGTKMMFYIGTYGDANKSYIALCDNASQKHYIDGTTIDKNVSIDNTNYNLGYVTVTKEGWKSTSYNYISNNNGWEGKQNIDINDAAGGELYLNAGTKVTKSATTATVNLSSSSVEQGTSSISLTNTLSVITPAYGSDLYVMYYLYDGTNYTLLNSDTASTKVSSTSVPYTIDTSSLSAGSYTVKTVLTDSNVYYVADSDDFTVTEATKTYIINYGTFTHGSVTGPTSAKEGDTVQLTVTPDEGYKLSLITTGTTATVDVNNYTFTMPANDVTINATFTSTTPATKEYYLVGTINGNHYLESYAENNPPSATEGYTDLSTYKFDENGELTLEITQDSYVFVSTQDKTLYTTNGWNGTNHPQTLYKNSSSPNKIQVNTGTYIFKITDITDDTLKLDYTPVTAATHNVAATAGANGSVDKTSQSVAEGSKYWVTATANANYVIDTFTVDGSEVSAASGQSSYTYEGTMGQSDVNINVTFKAATVTDEYYFKGDQDGWQVHKMLSSTDGTYYYYPLTTQNVQFLISESADFSSYYNKENVVQNYDGTDISEVGNYGDTNAYVWYANNGAQYYVRFYPGVNKICASTTVDGATDTFSVTMTQGVSSVIDGEGLRGNSGFGADDVSNVTYAKSFTKDNLSVQFYTKMQTNFNDTDYKYAVQGYSIVMTTTDGKQVASVLKENISQPKPGEYSGSYTFPENIVSATVTPVFTVSKEYAASKNITFTTVYLKYKPNSSPLNTYEPTYYTWRDNGKAQQVDVNGKTGLEREPEGGYNGQVMLYTGNDTYRVDVQSDILGVLFSANGNGGIQTFDYNEFWKLQQLGYDNITFEIKEGSSENVAKAISNAFKDKGNTVYSTPGDVSGIVNDNNLSDEFFLDTNIEGYVIDVFGNKLLDINGDAIKYDSLQGADEQAKLKDLLKKMDKTKAEINALYGARYGDGKIYGTEGSEGYGANTYYGMDYPIRVYYFNNLKQLISQQISGYGPIEGAASLEAGKTNREVYTFTWKYFEGTNAGSVEKPFSSEFNVIDKSYEQVPYLVSYKLPLKTNNIRVAGKWYYQRDIAQFDVNVQTAILKEGTISVSDEGGSATVNGQPNVTVNQGDIATFNATVNNGYAFVGWYNSTGEAVSAECYGTTTTLEHVATGNETVYAVFRKLQSGTLKVTNQLYRGSDKNPTPGGGSGNITATLYVKKSGSDTYVAYTNGEAQIQDGDMYYWVLTAKATGADKFIAFRQLETNTSSEYFEKYVELDTLDGNLKNDGDAKSPTYTFTSYETMWDWKDMTGSETATSYTIERYTDFQKVDVYATLNYHYQDRFGKDKLYVVRVRLSNDEIADHYKPSDATIKKNAPYINDLFKDCTWKVTNSELVTKTESRAEITAVHKAAEFDTYVESVNGTKNQLKKPFNTLIDLTTAAKNNNGNDFSYWMQYDVDSNGNVVDGSGVIFSYNREVSVRVTFNRKFEAVYGQSKELFTTNLQDAVYTREQSTNADGTVKYDYVYSDFLTQFETSIAGKTFADVVRATSDGTTSVGGAKNVRYGIVTEYNVAADKFNGEGTLSVFAPNFAKDKVIANIKSLYVKNTTGSWDVTSSKGDPRYNYYYNLYDLTSTVDKLTELGREDFFFKYENTAENRGQVYNVYSYVIYEDASGTHVVLSAPRIMNIYATGTTTNDPVLG